MNNYYATSKDMVVIEGSSSEVLKEKGVWIEYNPNIKAYRINSKRKLPREVIGYSPHKTALIAKAVKFKWYPKK